MIEHTACDIFGAFQTVVKKKSEKVKNENISKYDILLTAQFENII